MHAAPQPTDVFRAVADPTRRRVLELLRDGDRSVRELAAPFHVTQPAISQHLRVLREAGLVRSRRVGRRRVYRLNRAPLGRLQAWASRFVVDPFGHVWSFERSRHGDSRR
jgi:DNA-binding transcriptional ArsR family regulator